MRGGLYMSFFASMPDFINDSAYRSIFSQDPAALRCHMARRTQFHQFNHRKIPHGPNIDETTAHSGVSLRGRGLGTGLSHAIAYGPRPIRVLPLTRHNLVQSFAPWVIVIPCFSAQRCVYIAFACGSLVRGGSFPASSLSAR